MKPVILTIDDRIELCRRLNSPVSRVRQRAQIVLLAADGQPNRYIASILDLDNHTVGKWRSRFVDYGLDGLNNLGRVGRPPKDLNLAENDSDPSVGLNSQQRMSVGRLIAEKLRAENSDMDVVEKNQKFLGRLFSKKLKKHSMLEE